MPLANDLRASLGMLKGLMLQHLEELEVYEHFSDVELVLGQEKIRGLCYLMSERCKGPVNLIDNHEWKLSGGKGKL
jgi:hypothetical protein